MRTELRTAPTTVGVTVYSPRSRSGAMPSGVAEAVARRYRLDRVSRSEARFGFLHRRGTFKLTTNRFEAFHLHVVASSTGATIQVAQRNQTIVVRPALIFRLTPRLGRRELPNETKPSVAIARFESARSREVARIEVPVGRSERWRSAPTLSYRRSESPVRDGLAPLPNASQLAHVQAPMSSVPGARTGLDHLPTTDRASRLPSLSAPSEHAAIRVEEIAEGVLQIIERRTRAQRERQGVA